MATCAPTTRARAPTLLNLVQSRAAHTANVRRLPTTGGAEATSARGAAAGAVRRPLAAPDACARPSARSRSEEHTSELQSRVDLVCRLLLEKKKNSYRTADGYGSQHQ